MESRVAEMIQAWLTSNDFVADWVFLSQTRLRFRRVDLAVVDPDSPGIETVSLLLDFLCPAQPDSLITADSRSWKQRRLPVIASTRTRSGHQESSWFRRVSVSHGGPVLPGPLLDVGSGDGDPPAWRAGTKDSRAHSSARGAGPEDSRAHRSTLTVLPRSAPRVSLPSRLIVVSAMVHDVEVQGGYKL